MWLKGFLTNRCPNTFPWEWSLVWEHLIASYSERMFLAAQGIWVTDWMAGAKQFSFLSVDSDRVVLGSVSPRGGEWGWANMWTCVFVSGDCCLLMSLPVILAAWAQGSHKMMTYPGCSGLFLPWEQHRLKLWHQLLALCCSTLNSSEKT